MGQGRFDMPLDSLCELLDLPDGASVKGIALNYARPGICTIVIAHPDLPEVVGRQVSPEISPVWDVDGGHVVWKVL